MNIQDIKIGMRVVCPDDWDSASSAHFNGTTPEPNLGTVIALEGNIEGRTEPLVIVGGMREFDGMTTGEFDAADLEPAPQDA